MDDDYYYRYIAEDAENGINILKIESEEINNDSFNER